MSKRKKRTTGLPRKSRLIEDAQQARQAFNDGNYDKTIVALNTTQARDKIPDERRIPALAEAHFRRGHSLINRYPDNAFTDLQRAADLMPDDALYAYHVALAYHRSEQWQLALDWYQKTLKRDATFERAYLPYLLALEATGTDPTTDPIYQHLDAEAKALFLRRLPDDVEPRGLPAGLDAIQRGDWQQAEEHFSHLTRGRRTSKDEQALAYDYLGRIAMHNGDEETALKHWKKALRMGKPNPTLRDNLALFYVLRLESLITEGQYETAHTLVDEAIKLVSTHSRLQDIQAHIMLHEGYELARQGKWSVALVFWHKVVNASGNDARHLSANMALAYEELEQWRAAADAWRDFIKRRGYKPGNDNYLTPEQVARVWSRISTFYMRDGLVDDAVSTLQTALKHDEDNLEMGVTLARRLAEAERYEAAYNQLDRVLQKDPNYVEALAFRAELTEVAPLTWHYNAAPMAIKEWRKVLDTGDEAYVGIARQRLRELYAEAVITASRFNPQQSEVYIHEGLALFPDHHILRIFWISMLIAYQQHGFLSDDEANQQIQEQIALIDLSNEDMLSKLADILYASGRYDDYEDVLRQPEAIAHASPSLFFHMADLALTRDDDDAASAYIERGYTLAGDDEQTRKTLRVEEADLWGGYGYTAKAETIADELLGEDASYGPALMIKATVYIVNRDYESARKLVKKAKRWARSHQDTPLLQRLTAMERQMDNPLLSLFGGLDPSALPLPMRQILENMDPADLAELLENMAMNGFLDGYDDFGDDF